MARRKFTPQWAHADQVRDILLSYRQLQVQEKRRLWRMPVYIATGSTGDLEAAAREVDALENKAWCEQQW